MAEADVTRRLAAILAADIAGYTRLMEEDTDGTVAAWHAARSEVIDPTIAQYSGRIVKHTGDGFLARPQDKWMLDWKAPTKDADDKT